MKQYSKWHNSCTLILQYNGSSKISLFLNIVTYIQVKWINEKKVGRDLEVVSPKYQVDIFSFLFLINHMYE